MKDPEFLIKYRFHECMTAEKRYNGLDEADVRAQFYRDMTIPAGASIIEVIPQ